MAKFEFPESVVDTLVEYGGELLVKVTRDEQGTTTYKIETVWGNSDLGSEFFARSALGEGSTFVDALDIMLDDGGFDD